MLILPWFEILLWSALYGASRKGRSASNRDSLGLLKTHSAMMIFWTSSVPPASEIVGVEIGLASLLAHGRNFHDMFQF